MNPNLFLLMSKNRLDIFVFSTYCSHRWFLPNIVFEEEENYSKSKTSYEFGGQPERSKK